MRYGFKLALTLAFLVWLWGYLRAQDMAPLWQQWRVGGFWLSVALVPLNIVLQFLKWHALLRLAWPNCPPQISLYSLFAGFPLGLLTPGRWGELARGMYIPQITKEEAFTLSAVDKMHTLLVNAGLGSLALLYLIYQDILPGRWQWLAALSTFIFLGLQVVLLQPGAFLRWGNVLQRLSLSKATVNIGSWQVGNSQLRMIYALSLLFVATYCLQMVILVHSFVAVAFWPALASAAAIFFLKSALPFTIGELGIREGMAVFFFAGLQVPAPVALHASLLLFILNLVLPAGVGLLWIWKRQFENQTSP